MAVKFSPLEMTGEIAENLPLLNLLLYSYDRIVFSCTLSLRQVERGFLSVCKFVSQRLSNNMIHFYFHRKGAIRRNSMVSGAISD